MSGTDAILESISDGVFTVDLDWRVTSFNRAAELITGIRRKEAVGKPCQDVFRSSVCETDCALRQTLKNGKPVIGRTCYIIDGDGRRIPISISTAVLKDGAGHIIGGAETFRDLSEVEELRRELSERRLTGDMESRSPVMRRVLEVIPAVAASPSTVLIIGETGTGKEVLARAIHEQSPRKTGPFIAVNCGALPDTLLESELFGYKRGAFTGAEKDKPGRFALAKGGTLFLDEIGEISPALQVRLLRVLQERTYEPLGGTRSEKADVRIIAATNLDLREMMSAGRFREDLYYRVNVVRIELPPLRGRREDIPLLVECFIARFNRLMDKQITGITPEVMSLFMAYEWPGNIRELENAIERAFVLCPGGHLGLEHLPPEMITRCGGDAAGDGYRTSLDAMEAQAIREELKRQNNQRDAAARALGMHRTTLYRKMKKFGIR